MAESTEPGIDGLLAEARAGYAATLIARVAELAALASRSEWHQARRAAHKLRGSAATYGFGELGRTVGHVEDLLLAAHESPDDGMRARIDGLLCTAEACARAAAAATGDA